MVPQQFWCIPCKVNVSAPILIEGHLSSKVHLRNTLGPNSHNDNSNTYSSTFHCVHCNIDFYSESYYVNHLHGRKHLKKVMLNSNQQPDNFYRNYQWNVNNMNSEPVLHNAKNFSHGYSPKYIQNSYLEYADRTGPYNSTCQEGNTPNLDSSVKCVVDNCQNQPLLSYIANDVCISDPRESVTYVYDDYTHNVLSQRPTYPYHKEYIPFYPTYVYSSIPEMDLSYGLQANQATYQCTDEYCIECLQCRCNNLSITCTKENVTEIECSQLNGYEEWKGSRNYNEGTCDTRLNVACFEDASSENGQFEENNISTHPPSIVDKRVVNGNNIQNEQSTVSNVNSKSCSLKVENKDSVKITAKTQKSEDQRRNKISFKKKNSVNIKGHEDIRTTLQLNGNFNKGNGRNMDGIKSDKNPVNQNKMQKTKIYRSRQFVNSSRLMAKK